MTIPDTPIRCANWAARGAISMAVAALLITSDRIIVATRMTDSTAQGGR